MFRATGCFCCLIGLLLFSPLACGQKTAPNGWEKSTASGNTLFKHAETKSGEILIVKFYPRELLEGVEPDRWLLAKMINEKAPDGGTWIGKPEVLKQTGNLSSGGRKYKSRNGQQRMLFVTAVCVDKQYVRMSAVLATDGDHFKKHKAEAFKMMLSLLVLEKKAAVAEGRGLAMEVAPPKVKGITAGGKLKAGRYVGNCVSSRKNNVINSFELIIYPNGEYEFLKGIKDRDKTGRVVYSPASGRLNLTDDFFNGNYDQDEDFCIFGTDAQGKSLIYAQEKKISLYRFRLMWTDYDSKRLAPSEVKRQMTAAEAEAKRYKWVTQLGKGVLDEEIEAVVFTTHTRMAGTLQLEEYAYLLMKDGRVMDGLPVAPAAFDVAASRSREPDRWGWWKEEGDEFSFAWPVRPQDFRQPKGSMAVGKPIAKGKRLAGTWKTASTSGNPILGYSSVQFWGVHFHKDGRFEKFRHGMSQSGGDLSPFDSLITTAWNDEGASTSISSPMLAGGTTRKYKNPETDRQGTYEFDGYTLTLRFDSRRVQHLATFANVDLSAIWFEGNNLRRKKGGE